MDGGGGGICKLRGNSKIPIVLESIGIMHDLNYIEYMIGMALECNKLQLDPGRLQRIIRGKMVVYDRVANAYGSFR